MKLPSALLFAAGVLSLFASVPATAAIIISQPASGSVTFTNTFDSPTPIVYGTYSYTGGAGIVTGSTPAATTAPLAPAAGSYETTFTGTITISAIKAGYFQLVWGSVDPYNSIALTETGAVNTTTTFTGSQIPGGATTGNQTYVVGFTADAGSYFTGITLSSTANSFESDNHAFGNIAPVPEPATFGLFGVGLLVVGTATRKLRSLKR